MRPSRRLDRWVCGVVATALLACASAAGAAERALLLEVSVNGASTDKIGAFTERDGKLFVTAGELRELGLAPPKSARDDQEIDLSGFGGVSFRLDERTQRLEISAPVSTLAAHRLTPEDAAPLATFRNRDQGVVVNYDVTATTGSRASGSAAFASARWFGPLGVLSSDATASVGPGRDTLLRLDTRYTWSDPRTLTTVEAGDVISGALPYTRSVRLGGLRVATNFGLRPDLVTYPLPVVRGATAVPSTVDVLVNGVRQISRPVAAGPFYVPQVPIVEGAGRIAVVVRDATGRQTTSASSFYTTAALLTSGLSAYSVEVGAVRRRFGLVSDDYGDPAASATLRHGFTSTLTGETHLEAAGRLGLVTGGGTLALGTLGVASAALGASTSSTGTGGSAFLSLERATPRYHLAASALLTSAAYRDIAALNDDPTPRRLLQASAGFTLGHWGSLGASYTRLDRSRTPYLDLYGPTSAQDLRTLGDAARHASVASVTYSRELWGRVFAYATGYRDIANHQGAVTVGLSFRFGARGSVNTAVDAGLHQRQASVEASVPEVEPGDLGGRLFVSGGGQPRALGELRYRAGWGDVGLGVDHVGGDTYVRGEASGALVLMGRTAFAANTVPDAFAVVEAGDAPGVRVLLNNRVLGRTDARGRLLVPGLLSYQDNKLTLEADDLPVDARWSRLENRIAPADRAGVLARFEVRTLRAATAVLKLADGGLVPVGTPVAVTGAEPSATQVGYDGQVYLSDVSGPVTLKLDLYDRGGCRIPIADPSRRRGIADLGVLICTPTRP